MEKVWSDLFCLNVTQFGYLTWIFVYERKSFQDVFRKGNGAAVNELDFCKNIPKLNKEQERKKESC